MGLSPKREAYAAGLACGLSQAEAYRRAYPGARRWKSASVWDEASKIAARPEVRHRVAELQAIAAEANEVTVERVVRELAKVAFGDPRKLMTWGPSGVVLVDSTSIDDEDAATVAEVSETTTKDGGSIKLRRHDKVKALELLGKYAGAFERDHKQQRPQAPNFDAQAFFTDLFRSKI